MIYRCEALMSQSRKRKEVELLFRKAVQSLLVCCSFSEVTSGLIIDFLASDYFSVSREGGIECNSAH